jgi:G3E family GTPase
MAATAVIINEFGEIGIDHLLVETSTEVMVELNNGCVCCTIRGDLSDKLGSLAMWIDAGKVPPVDRVIVETTGLADPAPIMHTLMVEQDLLERYRLDRVVTIVDAIGGNDTLQRFAEATRQVAMADVIVLSKCDLAASHSTPAAQAVLRSRLAALNPRARVVAAQFGAVHPAICFVPAADVERAIAEIGPGDAHAGVDGDDDAPGHSHEGDARGAHADPRAAGIESFVVEWDHAVDDVRFNALLQELAADFGARMLRTKGIVQVKGRSERPAVIQGVQHIFFPVSWLDRWPDAERRSRLVFITQDLAPSLIRQRFRERLS